MIISVLFTLRIRYNPAMDGKEEAISLPSQRMGISPKAPYLLLRGMNGSPEPPSLERLAIMLDSVPSYEWVIRPVSIASEMHHQSDTIVGLEDELRRFRYRVDSNLVG